MNILIVGSVPFDGIRRRQQQVALHLAARGHEIVYVDPPRPLRSLVDPSAFEPEELPRDTAGESSAKEGAPAYSPHEHLRVIGHGVAMARIGRWGWATRVGWRMWARQARGTLRELVTADAHGTPGFAPDLAVVYHPALIPAVREALDVPIVFDCVEDFPSLASSRPVASAFEDALARGIPLVDGMIAVNRYIAESWGRLLRPETPTTVIEHGVDLTLFKPADGESRRNARGLLELSPEQPVAGYLGRFDARVSFEDLQHILECNHELLLLLLGEVSFEGQATLRRLPPDRVKHVGPLRQEQAAALMAAVDVFLIPFRREPHLEPIRGLKLYEYFATGLPVVAAFRRGLKAFRDLLYLYTTQEEMEEVIGAALREPADAAQRDRRIAAAQEASWEKRAGEIEAFLLQVKVMKKDASPAKD